MKAAKSAASSEYAFTGSVEYPILPWWQVELEVPVVSAHPSDSASQTGFGDLAIENKFRLQVYLTPGFNVRPLPGLTLRAGMQLPVTGTKEFDWTVHGGGVWKF